MGKSKYNLEIVRKIFKDRECELLEKEYKNNMTPMKYRCNCGNVSTIRLGNFLFGKRCRKCASEKLSKERRFSYKYVKKIFKDNGCELLEKEYKNNMTLMKYKCNCGNVSIIRFGDFLLGRRCKKCAIKKSSKKRRFSYKYVQQFFKDNGCELLEKEYKNNRTKVKFKCECGTLGTILFSSFKNGSRCYKCRIRNITEKNKKYDLKKAKKIFKDNGCKLLEKEYKNCTTSMRYVCNCGEISKIQLSNFILGQRCKKCGIKKSSASQRYKYQEIRKIFKDNGCKLLEKEYKNSKDKMRYKCNCGRISTINLDHFLQGQRCRQCAIKRNSGKNHLWYNSLLSNQDRLDRRGTKENRDWAKKIKQRDNYLCQCCRKIKDKNGKRKKLHAHHIIGYNDDISLRFILSNGITLCQNCHIILFHKIYLKYNNNQQQLDEFMANYGKISKK